jgi:hypothetical protein
MLLVVVLSLGLATVALALEFPKIDRRPDPADFQRDFQRGMLRSVPKYDPTNDSPLQVDLRSPSAISRSLSITRSIEIGCVSMRRST